MAENFEVYPSLGSALNARFRGHADRDWEEWQAKHFYREAVAIPDDAEQVWLGREEKLSHLGISKKQAVRHLIIGNADQSCIEEVGQLQHLERLDLEYPVLADDLSPLLALSSLRFLSIDSPRKLSDFSPLLKLRSLRTLIITNAKALANLDWLNSANHLEVIGIEGGMWSPMTIPSLSPLADLKSLQAFLGTSTKLTDKNLMPLAGCPNLKFIGIARVAPRNEFERLSQARPDIYCEWFRPEMWMARSAKRNSSG